MWGHPAPSQLQYIYSGQRQMESSLTLSLWLKPSGPQIQAPAHVPASCPALVKAEPGPNQVAMTQTHSSQSDQQRAEKCADMGNIPLDTSEAKE